jgi:hypothetical protein
MVLGVSVERNFFPRTAEWEKVDGTGITESGVHGE